MYEREKTENVRTDTKRRKKKKKSPQPTTPKGLHHGGQEGKLSWCKRSPTKPPCTPRHVKGLCPIVLRTAMLAGPDVVPSTVEGHDEDVSPARFTAPL